MKLFRQPTALLAGLLLAIASFPTVGATPRALPGPNITADLAPPGRAPGPAVPAPSPTPLGGPSSLATAPKLPAVVNVYAKAEDRLYQYPIEEYVKRVLASEIGLGLYRPYLSARQELNLLKAKAIVIRSYATYHAWFMPCAQPNRFGAWLDDTTWCQTLDHRFTGTGTDNISLAVSQTTGQILVYQPPTGQGTFQYIDTVFFASDNGTTRSAKSVWGTDHPYLQAQKDPYDERVSSWICSYKPGIGFCNTPRVGGYAGHGVGFSQDGAAGYARQGYTPTWIATHYYRSTAIYTATESIGP